VETLSRFMILPTKPVTRVAAAMLTLAPILVVIGLLVDWQGRSESPETPTFSHASRLVKFDRPRQQENNGNYPLFGKPGTPISQQDRVDGSSATGSSVTDSPAIAKTPPNPHSTGQIQGASLPTRTGIPEEDWNTIRSLPPICTSELPGMDHGQVIPAQGTADGANGASAPRQPVIQASANFRWPNLVPKEKPVSTGYPLAVASLPNPHANATATKPLGNDSGVDPHLEIYSRNVFPSAKDCATCHQQIYEEWANSGHAYAAVSPMFHAFEDKVNKLSQGTIGYFCLRCHAPVATTMGLRRDQAIWDGPRVFKEGVTCVACHRVKIPFVKADGERRMEPGDVYDPVYGSGTGQGVALAEKYRQFFKTKTDPHDKSPGQPMHRRAIEFEELSKSTFCMSCHQVAVKPGIKLEVVWDQYRASPACRDGVSCQDCHMGKVPGVDEGYSIGPAAVVNNKVVNPERKHSNHMFFGPGYSIAHPGVFPDNLKADRWTFNQWLEFDWRAGWGTERFEDAIAGGDLHYEFPDTWKQMDDRFDAREIIDANLKSLVYKKDTRRQLMENGSKLDGPFFAETPQVSQPLNFRYCLTNTSTGHNMPSGSLGAQPQLWMNVVLIGPAGDRLWETGYLDSNGDLADNHSLDVLARCIPLDTQLMNLQSKFLTTNVKGTDREMYLPFNFDFDQLPFLRPAQQPITVLNHPPFIRMEAHSIPALGSRNVKYSVPARLIQKPGTYRLSVRMRSRAEPIYFMRFCDSTPEMERMMNEWIVDFHTQTVTFEVR
jgi:nitrate/TMAO reductase-like tetraheme cytochrome c subunit